MLEILEHADIDSMNCTILNFWLKFLWDSYMMVYISHYSALKDEAGGKWVWGQCEFHSQVKASLYDPLSKYQCKTETKVNE